MDLRQYFRRIQELEKGLTDEYPVVISLETADGGKAGVVFEVSRANAAKLLVEGRAALASDEEKEAYVTAQASARAAIEKAELAKRVQFAVIPEADFRQVSIRKKDTQK